MIPILTKTAECGLILIIVMFISIMPFCRLGWLCGQIITASMMTHFMIEEVQINIFYGKEHLLFISIPVILIRTFLTLIMFNEYFFHKTKILGIKSQYFQVFIM